METMQEQNDAEFLQKDEKIEDLERQLFECMKSLNNLGEMPAAVAKKSPTMKKEARKKSTNNALGVSIESEQKDG